MAAPFSNDLRTRVVNTWLAGEHRQEDVARLFDVGVATIRRWTTAFRLTGDVSPKKPDHSDQQKKLKEESLQFLRNLLEEGCDSTDQELADRLREENGVSVSRQTVNRAINAMGYTRKKRLSSPRSVTRTG